MTDRVQVMEDVSEGAIQRVLKAGWHDLSSGVVALWRRARTALLWIALVVALGWCALEGWRLAGLRAENSKIAALRAGNQVEIDAFNASPGLIFAKLYDHLRRDQLEEAQQLLDAATSRGDRVVLAKVLYDFGNARLRRAIDFIEINQIDKATPLVNLAKEDYRRVLMIDPQNWDARVNYDVAQRLVRDLPEVDSGGEEAPEDAPKKLWTDLPGVPKGLP